ncbi:acid phosphatase 1-like isoform X1 [Asparagus officinalis]|uniref:acid phosphatase 1-like isoform X1 n=1 Tax=Asparagus officinalis TaxID=4686 RepID=UPI00098DEDBE|nr:acid phosphatase 1-like isoform X1 [Asparagus officinalis]
MITLFPHNPADREKITEGEKKEMGVKRDRTLLVLLLCLQSSLWLGTALGEGYTWNILDYFGRRRDGLGMSLKNYCESWKLNVELHNVRDFDEVPAECVDIISKYLSSSQFKADVQRVADESTLFLTEAFALGGDGKDAWIFDVDDTLLSNVPYYKKINFGFDPCSSLEANRTSLEKWMDERKAPAVEHMRDLYHEIRGRGLKIFIISSRKEHLRDATVNNLVKAGYRGWTELILRCDKDGYDGVKKFKAEQRKRLVSKGYRLWGVVGDQWSSLGGHPHARRTFKIPNPMYYVA